MEVAQLTVARALAASHLAGTGDRWLHVQTVGAKAEWLTTLLGLRPEVPIAAWMHKIGYSNSVSETGFHVLDGARWLRKQGRGQIVVGLDAHHSGATFEAEESGLAADLAQFPYPDSVQLDALNYCDLTTGPNVQRDCDRPHIGYLGSI